MTLNDAWRDSNDVAKCERSHERLCDFHPFAEDESCQAERCHFCGKTALYRKIDGKIDNVKYLRDHVRNFVQPFGASHGLFLHIYGSEGIKRYKDAVSKKKTKPSVDDYRAEAWDTYRTVKKLLDSGKQVKEIL